MRSTFVGYVRSMFDRAPVDRHGRARRRAMACRALESLEARLLLHANGAEDAEHAAVFGTYAAVQATGKTVEIGGLVPDSSVTIESLNPAPASPGAIPPTLSWGDPNSWVKVVNGAPQYVNGAPVHAIPQAGDTVLIAGGTTVTVDGNESAASLHAIRVDGTLTFSTSVSTKLLVDTIVVEPQGTWLEGTVASPIPAGVTAEVSFADNGDINTTWDPGQFSRGILTHGAVSIFGSTVQSDVAVPSLAKGTNQVILPSVPTGWQVGDRLIITGTTAPNSAGVNQDEQVAIRSITINGAGRAVITFTDPQPSTPPKPGTTAPHGLLYDHTAPAGDSVYVSDVSRNVVFDSQSIALGDNTVAHRGHTMFMHNGNVHIDAAGFYGLGRTDKRNPIDDPNPVEDLLAEQALAANPSAGLPADDYFVIASDPATGKYLGDANGNPIYATATGPNAKQLLDVNGNPVRKVMTTDVLDSKTGQRVMSPVVDAKGNPIPLYLTPQGVQVAIPQGQAVPAGDTPLYQLDANGNPLPVLDSSGNPVLKNGAPQYIPLYQTQIAKSGLNPRGRYAVHFHRTGTDPGNPVATINDSAVVDSPGWGIVNHSSDVNVSNNVVYNAVGAAYVTEAGDELGSFTSNIAIHSQGAGGGIEDRKNIGDFGQLGDGFWLQGGNVSLVGNISTGQRHSGFVFFPVGLNQKGLGVTQIAFDNLTPQVQQALLDASPLIQKAVAAERAAAAALKPGQSLTDEQLAYVPDGQVPLRQFDGNVAFADGDAMETWFSLLDFSEATMAKIAADPGAKLQSVVSNFTAWNSSGGIFDPYTNSLKFQNVTILGNLASPGGTAFNRNDVTRSLTFDHVNAQGWGVGINAPVNGHNAIIGGTFNDLKSIYITTANDKGRVVDIKDGGPGDPIHFLDNLTTKSGKAVVPQQQFDVYLQSNWNPKLMDITTMFNPDVIKLGTVLYNGQQMYFLEQAADFTPFPTAIPTGADPSTFGPIAASNIPPELLDLTEQQLWDKFGLALGGIVAPASAASVAGVHGLVGPAATYAPDLQLLSAKYVQYAPTDPSYTLKYKYFDAAKNAYVTVTETTKRQLHEGWNVLTINDSGLGHVRSLLIYGDDIAPTFALSSNSPLLVNQADVDNGSTYYISGDIIDASFGKKHFEIGIKLNDPTHIKVLDANHMELTFVVTDNAGNKYTAIVDLTVTTDAVLLKDVGRKDLPTITPSVTLIALIQWLDGKPAS